MTLTARNRRKRIYITCIMLLLDDLSVGHCHSAHFRSPVISELSDAELSDTEPLGTGSMDMAS